MLVHARRKVEAADAVPALAEFLVGVHRADARPFAHIFRDTSHRDGGMFSVQRIAGREAQKGLPVRDREGQLDPGAGSLPWSGVEGRRRQDLDLWARVWIRVLAHGGPAPSGGQIQQPTANRAAVAENSLESRVYASTCENGILSNVPFLIPIARARNNVYQVVWYSYAR